MNEMDSDNEKQESMNFKNGQKSNESSSVIMKDDLTNKISLNDPRESTALVKLLSKSGEVSEEYKNHLSIVSNLIMAEPQANIHKLKTLIEMLDIPRDNPTYGLSFFTIQKYTLITLNIIFIDIIPKYRIIPRGEQTSKKLKRETNKLLSYEFQLLKYYQDYLKRLERIILFVLKIGSGSNFYERMLTTTQAGHSLALIACNCLTDLLLQHFDFNNCEDLIDLSLRVICSKHATSKMKETIFVSLRFLFVKNPPSEMITKSTKKLAKLITALEFRVDPMAMNLFYFLVYEPISESYSHNESTLNRKQSRVAKSGRNRRSKKMKKIEQLLEENNVREREICAKHQLEVQNEVYIVYLKFLDTLENQYMIPSNSDKRNKNTNDLDQWYSPLVKIVLNGLNYLTSYSNDEMNFEILRRVNSFLENKPFKDRFKTKDKLIFLKYVLMMYMSPNNQFDFNQDLYHILFQISFDFVKTDDFPINAFELFLECVELMILKRIRSISLNHLSNFILKFLLMATEMNPAETMALISMCHYCIREHPEGQIFQDDVDDDYDYPAYLSNIWLPKNLDGHSQILIMDPNQMKGTIMNCIRLLSYQYTNVYVRLYAIALLLLNDRRNYSPHSYRALSPEIKEFMRKNSLDRDLSLQLLRTVSTYKEYERIRELIPNLI